MKATNKKTVEWKGVKQVKYNGRIETIYIVKCDGVLITTTQHGFQRLMEGFWIERIK